MQGTRAVRRAERRVVSRSMLKGYSPKGLREALAQARRDKPPWFVRDVTAQLERMGITDSRYTGIKAKGTGFLDPVRISETEVGISRFSGYCPSDHRTDATRKVIVNGELTELNFCELCATYFRTRRRRFY